MRKRLVTAARHVGVRRDLESLDLGTLATIEVTSKTLTIVASSQRCWRARLAAGMPLGQELRSSAWSLIIR